MEINIETLNKWRALAQQRGVKHKCSYKTKVSRPTIDKALSTGRMNAGTFTLLNKFFNSIKP